MEGDLLFLFNPIVVLRNIYIKNVVELSVVTFTLPPSNSLFHFIAVAVSISVSNLLLTLFLTTMRFELYALQQNFETFLFLVIAMKRNFKVKFVD